MIDRFYLVQTYSFNKEDFFMHKRTFYYFTLFLTFLLTFSFPSFGSSTVQLVPTLASESMSSENQSLLLAEAEVNEGGQEEPSTPSLETIQHANANSFGILTLIPPIVAIALAFLTKNVIISLFIGILTGAFMLSLQATNLLRATYGTFEKFTYVALSSLADPWNAGIVLQVLTIGGLIALISKLGGAKAVANALSKRAKSAKSSQFFTWLLGLFIFFDDYANSLIVGPIMRPVTGAQRVSSEKLSFIIDGTAAPVAGIMFVSTWIGYELSVIRDGFGQIGQAVSPFNIFLETIPYRFYNILMLLFILFIIFLARDFGPMYHAERRARLTGKLIADGATPLAGDDMEDMNPIENVTLSVWNAIIPIGVLIASALILFYTNGRAALLAGSDESLIRLMTSNPFSFTAIREAFGASDAAIVLFQAALIASILTVLMGFFQKVWSIKEALDIWVNGMKSLLITGVILILAWSLAGVIKELGTAYFLSHFLAKAIPSFLLPSLIFIFSCVISFATGTSYGTMGILMPLAIPIAHTVGGGDYMLILYSISAVLSGAILGDHCSPISDTTILSSMGAASDHLDHVRTQLPYAIVVGAIAIIGGYIPLGLGLPIIMVLPLSILLTFLIVRFVGKPVEIP